MIDEYCWTWGKALIKAIMKEGFEEGYCKECLCHGQHKGKAMSRGNNTSIS